MGMRPSCKSSTEDLRNYSITVGNIFTRAELLRSYLCKSSSSQKYQNLMHNKNLQWFALLFSNSTGEYLTYTQKKKKMLSSSTKQ